MHAPVAGDAAPVSGIAGIDNVTALGMAAVPEPGMLLLLGSGLMALPTRRARQR